LQGASLPLEGIHAISIRGGKTVVEIHLPLGHVDSSAIVSSVDLNKTLIALFRNNSSGKKRWRPLDRSGKKGAQNILKRCLGTCIDD
jgi:hypothetical protein